MYCTVPRPLILSSDYCKSAIIMTSHGKLRVNRQIALLNIAVFLTSSLGELAGSMMVAEIYVNRCLKSEAEAHRWRKDTAAYTRGLKLACFLVGLPYFYFFSSVHSRWLVGFGLSGLVQPSSVPAAIGGHEVTTGPAGVEFQEGQSHHEERPPQEADYSI